jgi:hypothetical protein
MFRLLSKLMGCATSSEAPRTAGFERLEGRTLFSATVDAQIHLSTLGAYYEPGSGWYEFFDAAASAPRP